ncbi:uncharacterized protein LOC133689179 [Populus nigra]|uniref:uncharacterized protein LOC133689179 n=1 Tax=Populus nigra TaxID=3691 RepID=UPI002B277B90|nr:uncharacterized protein LOC133689179 [Populus nigra]
MSTTRQSHLQHHFLSLGIVIMVILHGRHCRICCHFFVPLHQSANCNGGGKTRTKCSTVGIQGIAWSFGGMIFALVYRTAGISGTACHFFVPLHQSANCNGGGKIPHQVFNGWNSGHCLVFWWDDFCSCLSHCWHFRLLLLDMIQDQLSFLLKFICEIRTAKKQCSDSLIAELRSS